MSSRLYFTFPGGARRAVTLSFDDGTVHDRRLVEAFNRHGLKATFNLVPGRFGRDGVVSRDEVATLYAGHEIASHGWLHRNLDVLDPYRRLAEIRDGRAALEDLLGRPVRGFASPYGAHGDAAVDAMREAGVAYARTAGSSNDARWPVPDLLRWTQVSHERRALPLVEGALAKDGWGGTLNALALWGHGYEFEGRWDDLEALCARSSETSPPRPSTPRGAPTTAAARARSRSRSRPARRSTLEPSARRDRPPPRPTPIRSSGSWFQPRNTRTTRKPPKAAPPPGELASAASLRGSLVTRHSSLVTPARASARACAGPASAARRSRSPTTTGSATTAGSWSC